MPLNLLGWHASFCAGFIKGMLENNARHGIGNLDRSALQGITELAIACAADSIRTSDNIVSEEFVKTLK